MGRPTCLTEAEEGNALQRGASKELSDLELSNLAGLRDVVRPAMPRKWIDAPRAWLSNVDIDQVMQQYSRVVARFRYLGALPSDFAEHARLGGRCVEICKPDVFVRAFNTKALVAAIVNLDIHTGRGTHWVSLILDYRNSSSPCAYYYDATARPPPSKWLKSTWPLVVGSLPSTLRRGFVQNSKYNTAVHQRGNTECGVFAMMAVDALLSDRTFEDHCSRAVNDDDAFRHRSIFFNARPTHHLHSKRSLTWEDLLTSTRGKTLGGIWHWGQQFLS